MKCLKARLTRCNSLLKKNRNRSGYKPLLCFGLAVVGLCGNTVFADGEYGLSFGVFGGANLANLSYDTSPNSPRTGLGFGVNAEIPISGHFYIQPELGYLQKGQGTDYRALNAGGYSEVTLHYDTFETSLLAKMKFGNSEMKLELLLGPTFGYALSRKITSTTSGASPVKTTTDASSDLTGTDYGLVFGVGGEYKVVDGVALYLEGRYLMGFADINALSAGTVGSAIHTRGIYGLLGLRFWLNQI